MTSMPTIDDGMVALFRRTGKRRGSYRSGGMAGGEARVVPQQGSWCRNIGKPCITDTGAKGFCDNDHLCSVNVFRNHTFPHSDGG
jgi:hypothetical protein